MIVFRKFSKTLKIRNDHWKRLRARYNPENAIFDDEYGVYEIKRNCLFCNLYLAEKCESCPFGVFGAFGCFEFFERVFPKGMQFETGSVPCITWDAHEDKKARKQLNRLLRMMDKIEASQGELDDTK